jgi:tyrosine-protein phosphatase YwqE
VSLPWALDSDPQLLWMTTYGQRGTDVLIETPTGTTLFDRLLQPLLDRALRVILGHPERSWAIQAHPEILRPLSERGVLAQVNAASLLAPRRSPVHACAAHLCRQGLAQVIASDGHRGGGVRGVVLLAHAVEVASEIVGSERARWMAGDAPAAIIDGRTLPAAPAVVAADARRRFFWQRDDRKRPKSPDSASAS